MFVQKTVGRICRLIHYYWVCLHYKHGLFVQFIQASAWICIEPRNSTADYKSLFFCFSRFQVRLRSVNMLPIIVLLFIPSLVLGDKKELPSLNHDTKWLCDHHFHPVKDRMVENMVKMEICAVSWAFHEGQSIIAKPFQDEVNKEKATKLSNCIPSQSHSMSYFMTMCDDRQKYESVYKEASTNQSWIVLTVLLFSGETVCSPASLAKMRLIRLR